MGQPFFAYILRCADCSYYVGHTDDLVKRVAEHESGVGCVYTSKRLPITLVWSQEFSTREEAKAAESQMKGWSRAKKEALIQGDFEVLKVLAKKTNWPAHRGVNTGQMMGQEEQPGLIPAYDRPAITE